MDPNPPQRPRGRARNDPPSQVPRNEFRGQPQYVPSIPRQRQPFVPHIRRSVGVPTLRMPHWSNQSDQRTAVLPHVSVLQNAGSLPSSSTHNIVEQISEELDNFSTNVVDNEVVQRQIQEEKKKDVPIPIGRRREARASQMFSNKNESLSLVPRPVSSANGKQGINGETVDLVTNYFPITSYKNQSLYQYTVDFNPEEDRIGIQRGLLRQHKNLLGRYLFDGTSIISFTKYDSEKFDLTSKRNIDGQVMTITLTYTTLIGNNDHVFTQVLNLLLRSCQRKLGLTQVGRNFYNEKAKIHYKMLRLQVWSGTKITAGIFENGLLVQAEICKKIMRDETVLDFFHQCLRNRNSESDWMTTFKMGVIGTSVLTRYNNKTYMINDIDDHTTPRSTFKLNGSETTYIDYYKERWNLTIRDHNQPLLVSKKKCMYQNNDDDDLIYLVPELCSLTGLSKDMRENNSLMRELSASLQVDPTDRIKTCVDYIKHVISTKESGDLLKEWDFKVNDDCVKLKGRVLKNETLQCNTTHYASGGKANWTYFVHSQPMYKSVKMDRWVVIYPSPNDQVIHKFVNIVKQIGNRMSFRLPQPRLICLPDVRINSYLRALEHVINEMNPSLIVCVTVTKRGDLYNLIKRKLCVDRAVPSQVVLLRTVQNFVNRNMSIGTKITVQLNCKLGGAPWTVEIPTKGMMIVGFDVCHDKTKKASYGAIVASINDDNSMFYSNAQPHHSGVEISNNFVTYMTLALHAYVKLNQCLPKSIVIYRDGVGDGQIFQVHNIEIAGIMKACAEFYEEKEIPLAFIIVKKRINTRFFLPVQSGFVNPKPGTIVDSVVTDPTMYDFFLISQNVTVSTVTPTHYNVIVDNLPNWSPDRMQSLTYKLTHLYYNWSGTIRVPAHCQYAHKLASLAAQALEKSPNEALSELLYFL